MTMVGFSGLSFEDQMLEFERQARAEAIKREADKKAARDRAAAIAAARAREEADERARAEAAARARAAAAARVEAERRAHLEAIRRAAAERDAQERQRAADIAAARARDEAAARVAAEAESTGQAQIKANRRAADIAAARARDEAAARVAAEADAKRRARIEADRRAANDNQRADQDADAARELAAAREAAALASSRVTKPNPRRRPPAPPPPATPPLNRATKPRKPRLADILAGADPQEPPTRAATSGTPAAPIALGGLEMAAASLQAEADVRRRNDALRRAFDAVPGGPQARAQIEALVAKSPPRPTSRAIDLVEERSRDVENRAIAATLPMGEEAFDSFTRERDLALQNKALLETLRVEPRPDEPPTSGGRPALLSPGAEPVSDVEAFASFREGERRQTDAVDAVQRAQGAARAAGVADRLEEQSALDAAFRREILGDPGGADLIRALDAEAADLEAARRREMVADPGGVAVLRAGEPAPSPEPLPSIVVPGEFDFAALSGYQTLPPRVLVPRLDGLLAPDRAEQTAIQRLRSGLGDLVDAAAGEAGDLVEESLKASGEWLNDRLTRSAGSIDAAADEAARFVEFFGDPGFASEIDRFGNEFAQNLDGFGAHLERDIARGGEFANGALSYGLGGVLEFLITEDDLTGIAQRNVADVDQVWLHRQKFPESESNGNWQNQALGIAMASMSSCGDRTVLDGGIVLYENCTAGVADEFLENVGQSGVTVGNFIFIDRGLDLSTDKDLKFLFHEIAHVHQYAVEGGSFLSKYGKESAANGYDRNRYEVDARQAADEMLAWYRLNQSIQPASSTSPVAPPVPRPTPSPSR